MQVDAKIGHNGGPSFDDIVRENMDRGLLLTIKDVLVEAARDPRVERRHLRVLVEIVDTMNYKSGVSYPGRRALAERTKRYADTQGYTEAGISKTLSELVSFGYLVRAQRQIEKGGRPLSHYTLRKPSNEELVDEITKFIEGIRSLERPKFSPSGLTLGGGPTKAVNGATPADKPTASRSTPEGGSTGGGSTCEGGPMPAARSGSGFTRGSTPAVPTVTSSTELVVRKNNNTTQSEPVARLTRQGWDGDDRVLASLLEEAASPCLDNPANRLGLASVAEPLMWLRNGCDLELDILPTLRAFAKTKAGTNIRSWSYFTAPVQKARDGRLKGMAPPPPPRFKTGNEGETPEQREARLDAARKAQDAEDEHMRWLAGVRN